MKTLTLIIHANDQQEVADALRTLDPVKGFTFTHVEGHGAQVGHDPFLSTRDKVVGYTPRVRVDTILDDQDVESVLAALRGRVGGQGIYWIAPVERYDRL